MTDLLYPETLVTEVACWRCGNPRLAGSAWCRTCHAPERAGPGVHQTYRGILTVQSDPDDIWEDQQRRRRTLLVWIPICIVIAFIAWYLLPH